MSRIISVHSYRGGTGKSNTTANIATLLAAGGRRVGVIDTDIQSPGIHILFGLHETDTRHALNDYLWGKCDITQVAHDVTARLQPICPARSTSSPPASTPGSNPASGARATTWDCSTMASTNSLRRWSWTC